MSTSDKAANKVQDIKGRVKEKAGQATGDEELEAEGKIDQVTSAAKQVGEKVKDVGEKVKEAGSKATHLVNP